MHVIDKALIGFVATGLVFMAGIEVGKLVQEHQAQTFTYNVVGGQITVDIPGEEMNTELYPIRELALSAQMNFSNTGDQYIKDKITRQHMIDQSNIDIELLRGCVTNASAIQAKDSEARTIKDGFIQMVETEITDDQAILGRKLP